MIISTIENGRIENETAFGMRMIGETALIEWNVMTTLYIGEISSAAKIPLMMFEMMSMTFLTLKGRELINASMRRCFLEVIAPAKPK